MRENLEVRAEMLRYLARRISRGEGPPTVAEVGEAVGLRSTQTAHKHLKKLEEAGYVERPDANVRARARGIGLTGKGWEAAGHAPLLGRVAAGGGLEAIANEDPSFSLMAELLGSRSGRRRYVLEARGDSMTGAGIEEGDHLLVEENEDPPDGAAVVALLQGEKVTVKRLQRHGEMVKLKPQNEEHGEILLPAEEVTVQGEVVLVMHPPRRS